MVGQDYMRVDGVTVTYCDEMQLKKTSIVYVGLADHALYYEAVIGGSRKLVQFDAVHGKAPSNIEFKHVW